MEIFEQITEISNTNVEVIGRSLTITDEESDKVNVPEVLEAYKLAQENPSKVGRIFAGYMNMMFKISELTPLDLNIIENAHKIREEQGGTSKSASKFTVVNYFHKTTKLQQGQLDNFIFALSEVGSETHNQAIEVLTEMMHKGHLFKEAGKAPQDGDPEADALIWGHTQLSDPNVLIEFTICHFIERYMTVAFKEIGLDMSNHKDWFFNVFTDVLALEYAKNPDSRNRIMKSWSIPRREGGLGWFSDSRREAFIEALESYK